jgi:cellulose synthase (UDP-forming)
VEPGALTLWNLLAPTIFVLGAVYILVPLLPIGKGWARYAIFAVVWSIAAWYLHWRLFVTMLPAEGEWYELGWLWFCFAVELLSIFDQLILYVTFLRTSNRSAEADRHEARIRNAGRSASLG